MRTKCDHGMPSPKSCVTCMDEDGLGSDPVQPETVEYYFIAKFDGHCGICNLPTMTGTEIAKTTKDRYVHGDCI